jgi:hypothetical protein
LLQVSVPESFSSKQSAEVLHCTQLPLPSQTEPPLSLQSVPSSASLVPQVPVVHVRVLQRVVVAEQSVGELHWTQVPDALQTWPPLSLHDVPCDAFVKVHAWLTQPGILQRVLDEQSPSPLHATQ